MLTRMECFLPTTAFESAKSDDTKCCDSTKCVDGCDLSSSCGSICDVSTPICNSVVNRKLVDYVVDSKPVNTNVCNQVKTDIVETEVGLVCKSPPTGSVNRLIGLDNDLHSFALDDSMSNVCVTEGGLSVCVDLNLDSEPSATFTPIKCSHSTPRNESLNIQTRLEPHVNISDDEAKNPILANSVRRTRGISVNNEDVLRSLRVLGNSRCWTDVYENELDDSLSATQSPIRSLTSLINSSQNETSDASVRRFSAVDDFSPSSTPVRSYSRSVNRFRSSENQTLDKFRSMTIAQISTMALNPMCEVTLTNDQMCKCKLSDDLEMLYKHFKNMCTIIRRSSMRNDLPYFRVVQMLVQRMSRKSFSFENLRQMVWLAPNLISIKWVLVSESCKKKHPSEYKDSIEKIYDISIKLLRPDLGHCSTTHDYENVCFRFKTVLCCWSLKCRSEHTDFQVPMAEIPENKVRSNYSTPRRDYTPIRLDETPVGSFSKNASFDFPTLTPRKSYKMADSDSFGHSSKRLKTLDSVSPMSVDLLDTPGMRRIRENARKIANEKRETNERVNDLVFWTDLRWFTKILLELMVSDNSPIMKPESFADFITKYGCRKVSQNQVNQWVEALIEIDPSVIEKSVSKFEDYSTVLIINKSASLNKAVDHIDQKIKNLKSI